MLYPRKDSEIKIRLHVEKAVFSIRKNKMQNVILLRVNCCYSKIFHMQKKLQIITLILALQCSFLKLSCYRS